ncbi:unnamed protein product [Effrenium voratum]|uniref:Uncharacterized protein n=1 Tax=Effrenium voratum TaxID=2562239 RepID=A0AA36HTC8_9DINO|nr:unnamed protein product [Effrenium voratum]CAJ1374317.1 unnamed protein product [Effrenium voratum]CAJ1445178.1 unnamed protein product [Effrenium voratum]
MDNFAAAHGAWQQHLGREKRARQKTTLVYYGRKGGKELLAPKAPPAPTVEDVSKVMFDRLYQSNSLPALSEAPSSRGPRRLKSCGLERLPERREAMTACSNRSNASRRSRAASSGGQSRQEQNLLFFNDQQRQRTPSIRSSMSQLSATSSLWLEVEKAVQEEVAKVVKPLQERLVCEEQARKRAEEALRICGGAEAEMPS